MEAYLPMIKDTLGMFAFLGIELSVLFLLISAGVSLLQQYIPDSKIQAILSGSKGRGYIMAAILGAVTPFCSCSTIPMLRGLLKAKAGFGPTLTFLFTSPLLNPIIIGLFLATFGFKVTMVYAAIALGVSIIAGIFLDRMRYERHVIPVGEAPVSSCCGTESGGSTSLTEIMPMSVASGPELCCASAAPSCCAPKLEPLKPISSCCGPAPSQPESSCCGETTNPGPAVSCCGTSENAVPSVLAQKLRKAASDAWVQFKQVFPYLLLGVALGSLVYGFVPSEFIAEYASGDSIFAVPIAAVIGIPLYVRVEALIPLSAVLVGKGMGLGAVMALIIGGGGASLTEVILLKSMFRMPMIIAFLTVILGMAVLAGYLFQFVL